MNTPQEPLTRIDRARTRIESGFSRWGEVCHDHPWWIIAAVVSMLVFVSFWLPTMQVDTSNESFLREDDPNRQTYREFQDEFGKDERIVVLIESRHGVINDAFLKKLKTLHERYESIPQVDKVSSLINARMTLGQGDELIVKDLLEDWPSDAAEFAALGERVLANPLYKEHFVSADLKSVMLLVTPDTYTAIHTNADADVADLADFDFESGFDNAEQVLAQGSKAETLAEDESRFITDTEVYSVIDAIRAINADYQNEDIRIGIAGSAAVAHAMTYIMGGDMFLFSGLGILLISTILFLVFRRWVLVILPVLVSAMALHFTIGLMCLFGMVVTTSVQILPSLLLAIGVGNAVHLFTVYFQAIDSGKRKREALSYALGHSGLAVLMTGLTTAGGLMSFITANLAPISDMGITSPMGILSALFFSLVLLPALIAVTPHKNRGLRDDSDSVFQRFLAWCAMVSTSFPRRVILAWSALIAVSVLMASQIRPSHFPLYWFPESMEIRQVSVAVDEEFGGASFTEIVVDTGKENGLHDPELLQSVDRALAFMDELVINDIQAGNSTSILDVNKELHQALNGNNPDYYRIPDDRALIAQELLLFENSGNDDLKELVDPTFSKMRITTKMPFVDGVQYPEYLDKMTAGFQEIVGDQAQVTFTGVITILAGSVKLLIGDTIRAYTLAFLIITPLMMLLVGSVRTGLISMIPNLAPIAVTLAMMSVLGIPLDAFNLLVGSVALGLAVDDTIHFMHNYRRYFAATGDAAHAVRETLRTTGKALMITSVVLSIGFFVNLFGTMHSVQNFGMLTGFCIVMAFLADVLLAPALVVLLAERKQKMSLKEKLA